MAGHGDDLYALEFGQGLHQPEPGAGLHGLGEPVGRDMEVIEHGPRPVGRMDVQQLRGAGDGQFVLHAAGQEIVEIVGQQQAARCEIGHRRTGGDGFGQLEGRVVKDIGDAGGGVDAREGGARLGQVLQARLGARIAVGVERKHEAPGVIEEHVVDPPGVDADRGEARAAGQGGGGEAQAGLHLMPQGADVPVVMRAERAEGVGKAVDLAQSETVF